MLPLGLERAVGQLLPGPAAISGIDSRRGAVRVEDDGGDVVVEQHPLAVAVGAAGEEDLERVVARRTPTARPRPWPSSASISAIHWRVRGAAQAEAVGEQAGPVLAGPGVAALAVKPLPQRSSAPSSPCQ